MDALSFYQERLQALLQEVEQAQTRCLPPNEHVMPAAFVTFTQRRCEVRKFSGLRFTVCGFHSQCQLTSHLLSTSKLRVSSFAGISCLSLPQQGWGRKRRLLTMTCKQLWQSGSRMLSQVTAAASMIHHQRTAWITGPAPGPEEIIWKNLG